jgi:hypothetical protein
MMSRFNRRQIGGTHHPSIKHQNTVGNPQRISQIGHDEVDRGDIGRISWPHFPIEGIARRGNQQANDDWLAIGAMVA